MKKAIVILILSVSIIGCSDKWAEIEAGAQKTAAITAKGEQVATVLSPFTNGYGTATAAVLSGIGNIALAISALAASKKKKALAQAAVDAAETVSGGGKAIVEAAVKNGVAQEINTAHKG